MNKIALLLMLSACLFLGACQQIVVPIRHMAAAEGSIPSDVQKIAIFPYEYDETRLNPAFKGISNTIPDYVAQEITSYGTYGIAEREKLKQLMKEAIQGAGDIVTDPEKLKQVAQVAEAQALVVGKVNNIAVEELRNTKQLDIPSRDPDYPNPQIKEFPYLIRRITLNVHSEMLHVTTKQKIITTSFSRTYDSEKDQRVTGRRGLFGTRKDEAYYANQVGRVPAVDQIINELARECAQEFIKKISSYPVNYSVALEEGSGPDMKQGLDWAKNKQYETAIQQFTKATGNPEIAAVAWFNIGTCYEAMQKYPEAMNAYQQCNNIKHFPKAVEGIARIRRHHPGL